jgi:3D-(3,5/4)-trihydroxycyclohexane-1,2-dione acylhydrolase (decyclizing)
MKTIRLTMAQALIKAMIAQKAEIDGKIVPFFAGVWTIFGNGNVAGIGEALYEKRDKIPALRAHNEQGMVHAAVAFAKARGPAADCGCEGWSRSAGRQAG